MLLCYLEDLAYCWNLFILNNGHRQDNNYVARLQGKYLKLYRSEQMTFLQQREEGL